MQILSFLDGLLIYFYCTCILNPFFSLWGSVLHLEEVEKRTNTVIYFSRDIDKLFQYGGIFDTTKKQKFQRTKKYEKLDCKTNKFNKN